MTQEIAPTASAEQRSFFEKEGYLSIPAITDAEEIAWFRETYERLLADERAMQVKYTEPGASGVINQIFGAELREPKLVQTRYVRNALAMAAELLGVPKEKVSYGGMLLIYKPPGAGRDVPWHQDEAYWDTFDNKNCHSLSVWMPLDEVTVDSGCMQFLPQSHHADFLNYRQPEGAQPLVLADPVDVSAAVACPLPPGGATFHHCRTLHYTGPNTSPRGRRACTTIFHGPTTDRAVPRPRPWLKNPFEVTSTPLPR
jgi:ectoine hydroxylase-related dioxygenase (phytanoyl-CoA dioxygenase family)